MDYGSEKRKCAECGYLSTADPEKIGELVGVDQKRRDSWQLPVIQDQTLSEFPICWVGAHPIDKESTNPSHIDYSGGRSRPTYNFSLEVKKERYCEEWTRWIIGLSPKAHWDMGLVKDERLWREKCDKEREERSNAFQKEQKRDDRRFSLLTPIVVVVLSVILSWVSSLIFTKNNANPVQPSSIQLQPIINNIIPSPEKIKDKQEKKTIRVPLITP